MSVASRTPSSRPASPYGVWVHVVLLRPWRESDVPAQLEAFGDPFFQPRRCDLPRCDSGATLRNHGGRVAELRFPAVVLEDAVVRLRPWRETDVRSQLEAFSDP